MKKWFAVRGMILVAFVIGWMILDRNGSGILQELCRGFSGFFSSVANRTGKNSLSWLSAALECNVVGLWQAF